MEKKKILAFLYDFDKTLCNEDMQNYAFIPDLDMTPSEFWSETSKFGEKENMEKVLTNGCEHATLGIANGAAHFNDFELSKQVNEIKVGFRVL